MPQLTNCAHVFTEIALLIGIIDLLVVCELQFLQLFPTAEKI